MLQKLPSFPLRSQQYPPRMEETKHRWALSRCLLATKIASDWHQVLEPSRPSSIIPSQFFFRISCFQARGYSSQPHDEVRGVREKVLPCACPCQESRPADAVQASSSSSAPSALPSRTSSHAQTRPCWGRLRRSRAVVWLRNTDRNPACVDVLEQNESAPF